MVEAQTNEGLDNLNLTDLYGPKECVITSYTNKEK